MAQVHANTEPVGFDFVAAQRLIAEFSNAATALRQVTAARSTLAEQALAEFRGAFARQFRTDMQTCRDDSIALAATYEEAAEQIRALRESAENEQKRRDAARQWEEEQARRSNLEKFVDSAHELGAGILGHDSPNRPPLPPQDPPVLHELRNPVHVRYLDAGAVSLDVN